MIDGFNFYLDQFHRLGPDFWGVKSHDGGPYVEAADKLPVIGPSPKVEGAYYSTALGGYGIMSSCAAGDLVARWVTGASLPTYAEHFTLDCLKQKKYRVERKYGHLKL